MGDTATKRIGEHLLQGWTMLGDTCPNGCNIPLMRSKDKKSLLCVACETDFLLEAKKVTEEVQVASNSGTRAINHNLVQRLDKLGFSLAEKLDWISKEIERTVDIERLSSLIALSEKIVLLVKVLESDKMNKWTSPQTTSSFSISQAGTVAPSPCLLLNRSVSSSSSSASEPAYSSHTSRAALLLNTLRDNGFDELTDDDLRHIPSAVTSVLWKLLSEKQGDLRQLVSEREQFAKVANDNKQLKTKVGRLVEQVEKLQNEIQSQEINFSKKELEWKNRLEETQRVRFEWEKCAVTYKSREKHYVAELRKQEGEYEKLQSRVGGGGNGGVSPLVTSSVRRSIVTGQRISPPSSPFFNSPRSSRRN